MKSKALNSIIIVTVFAALTAQAALTLISGGFQGA